MSLNFPQTCPKIDKGLEKSHDWTESNIEDMTNAVISKINNVYEIDIDFGHIRDIVEDYVQACKDDISTSFEIVRATNSDMQDVANEQIEDLENTIEALNDTILELESRQ